MKRQEGYLQLNNSLNNEEIDIINTNSITKIGADTNQWVDFNGKRYFIKNSEDWERELICSVFLQNLGIKSVNYDIAIINNNKYIISEDYRKEGNMYVSGATIIDEFYYETLKEYPEYFADSKIKNENIESIARMFLNNLEYVWNALECRYKNNPNKEFIVAELMHELEKRFLVRSVLLMDNDYHPDNWCIEEGESIKLVPCYDFGSCLKGNYLGMPFGVFMNDTCDSHIIQFENYLAYTDKESVYKFIDLFEKATPELFKKTIEIVEEKIESKIKNRDQIIEIYTNNYDELNEIISNYRGKHGR